jgi:uncharacterized protein (DUF433 family)
MELTKKPLDLSALPLPSVLERTPDGTIRVSGHRVSLYLILDATFDGKSIAELHSLFPTVPIDQLQQVVAFCDQHAETMRRYFQEQDQAARAAEMSHQQTGPTLAELRDRRAKRRGRR